MGSFCVVQVDLELVIFLPSASQVLGLQACTTMPGSMHCLIYNFEYYFKIASFQGFHLFKKYFHEKRDCVLILRSQFTVREISG
jgi:hypothetical protein